MLNRIWIVVVLCAFGFCGKEVKKKPASTVAVSVAEDEKAPLKPVAEKKDENFRLTTENAIPFFYQYAKAHKENKVRIEVAGYGTIDILLFDKTPYHRANFIYLAKKHYFDGSCFHRVVRDFVIQGGNSDTYEVRNKRQAIGKYLLPPDTKKGFKHHRGTVSMPSSDIDNPYEMASPYEFFIVVQAPGAYHLDGKYTAFGEVIGGMDVVDKINKVETDERDWPKQNIIIQSVRVID